MMVLYINDFKYSSSKKALVNYREGGFSSHEYGGANFARTKIDFGQYLYDVVGKFWGLSLDDCTNMFGLDCFNVYGIRRSFYLSTKIEDIKLKYNFLYLLFKFSCIRIIKNILKKMISFY
jgi:hypothetical protein